MGFTNLSWRPAPKPLSLGRDEVHVWRASLKLLEAHLARFDQTLAAEERERAARFRFEKDRNQYIVTRGVLRTLLGRYLEQPPAIVGLRYNPQGKPELDMPADPDTVHFNVSHSHGLALLTFTRGRLIGVDIEAIRDDVERDKLAKRFFSPREAAKLRALPQAVQQKAFFDCWTRKEAYIKARGEGLSIGLDQFDVSLAPGEPPALLRVEGASEEPSGWFIADVAPGPEHAGALAVQGPTVPTHCWQYG